MTKQQTLKLRTHIDNVSHFASRDSYICEWLVITSKRNLQTGISSYQIRKCNRTNRFRAFTTTVKNEKLVWKPISGFLPANELIDLWYDEHSEMLMFPDDYKWVEAEIDRASNWWHQNN